MHIKYTAKQIAERVLTLEELINLELSNMFTYGKLSVNISLLNFSKVDVVEAKKQLTEKGFKVILTKDRNVYTDMIIIVYTNTREVT